jgi:hypothetical protein
MHENSAKSAMPRKGGLRESGGGADEINGKASSRLDEHTGNWLSVL